MSKAPWCNVGQARLVEIQEIVILQEQRDKLVGVSERIHEMRRKELKEILCTL